MPVILTTSGLLPPPRDYSFWVILASERSGLSPERRLPGIDRILEQTVDAVQDEVWEFCRRLGRETDSAEFGHSATCNTNVSDLGTMLAWSKLFAEWCEGQERILVICDDPWLFRHLAQIGGTIIATAPAIRLKEWHLRVRGFAARTLFAVRALTARLRLGSQKRLCPSGAPSLVSYGHPSSQPDGHDGYFGPLMIWDPRVVRLLHSDCTPKRARELGAQGRSFSLNAWANAWYAFALPFMRWRPGSPPQNPWLVRRAAALDNSTGQAAAIAWQKHCQARWLRDRKPSLVMWPWENHGWERMLARQAKALDVTSIGYQHTVVGRRHWIHVATNFDGVASLPDRIICNGQIWVDVLVSYGIPRKRIAVVGALRFSEPKPLVRDPAGPVYIALPFAHAIARQIDDAIRPIARSGQCRFIVRGHPMNPYPLRLEPGIGSACGPLSDVGPVAVVLYAATTVGLEAVLGGIPVVRFIPAGTISVDVFPESLDVPAATAAELKKVLAKATNDTFEAPDRNTFFCRPNQDDWIRLIDG